MYPWMSISQKIVESHYPLLLILVIYLFSIYLFLSYRNISLLFQLNYDFLNSFVNSLSIFCTCIHLKGFMILFTYFLVINYQYIF